MKIFQHKIPRLSDISRENLQIRLFIVIGFNSMLSNLSIIPLRAFKVLKAKYLKIVGKLLENNQLGNSFGTAGMCSSPRIRYKEASQLSLT